ncbi:hypothetical protein UY3_00138 [Chelonia mydas]|uniref:Uncharacterized protein n=1 Tax=Chelonia mydas TaxID=8469 RepID=M7C303_CHEMY|nr:hypothetical protein UY3_00138 [Chelonia mydas]
MEAGFGGKEDDDYEEIVDSSEQGSGQTGFHNIQDLFITLDVDPVPPNPPKAGSRTLKVERGPLDMQKPKQMVPQMTQQKQYQ